MKIAIYAKCDDRCAVSVVDEGKTIYLNDGYPPEFLRKIAGSDELEFEIDNETGKIIGWVPLTVEEVQSENEEEVE